MGCPESSCAREVRLEAGTAESRAALAKLHGWLRPQMGRKLQYGLEWQDTIEEMAYLIELDLSQLSLKGVPREIGLLASLTKLELSDNMLAELPRGICELISIRELNLEDNRLRELPAEVGRLVLLQTLRLHRNQLLALPPDIGKMQSLELLALQENQLQSLPDTLGLLGSLEELNLSGNILSGVPPALGNLRTLRRLYLGRNALEGLPDELNCLEGLDVFCIEDNMLSGIFNLYGIFDSLANRHGTELRLFGNRFEPVNFGDDFWTCGPLHKPLVLDKGDWLRERSSVCTASFCGAEFLDWQQLLARTQLQNEALWSHLCVFLPDYATAASAGRAPHDWHVGGLGSEECLALGRYFEAANEMLPLARRSEAHKQFGCCWFQQWTKNIQAALAAGHRRFVVFTQCDRTVGPCQTVEWLYLLQAKQKVRDMKLHCVAVSDTMRAMEKGPFPHGFSGRSFEVFSKPSGLPVALPPGLEKVLRKQPAFTVRRGSVEI